MPLKKWIEGANYAIEGILYAAKTQKHLRYHFYAAVLILLLSFILGISRLEFIVIAIVVILVLLAEMLNTAIEATVDLVSREYNPKAKIAKDIAAGAVLVTASGAVVIGFIILLPPLKNAFYDGIKIAKHTGENIAIIALVVVIISVIITKAYFGKGLPLSGGLPSGHTAIAFSVWVTVTFLSESFLLSLLVFILVVWIAQSRVTVGAHRPWEVILGAMLGIVVTFLLFKMFL